MSSNTSMVFKRGELRILSAALIESNRDKSISEVAQLHVENFGFFEHKVAVVHVRWMLREGLVNDAATLMETWSRKNDKSLAKVKAPKIAKETPAAEITEEAPKAKKTKGKSMASKKVKAEEAPAQELETA